MINELKESLWKQFGAGIDMLTNAIQLCPEDFLKTNPSFFYISYHTILLLDYYLTIPPKNFEPLLPFTIKALEELPEGVLGDMVPDRMYEKKELLEYVRANREKAYELIGGLTEEKVNKQRFVEDFEEDAMDYSVLEILLYTMRHVQHHTAQLHVILRQEINDSPKWVFRAEEKG